MLVPRDKETWVFIGWHRGNGNEIFADNTKYFYLYVSQEKKEVRPIWLAKDERTASVLRENGFEAYYENSLKGIWYALRSGYTVIDAFLQRNNFRLSGRSKIIQLLHGKGMKKKGYSEKQLRKQDMIFHTSNFTMSIILESFKAGAQNFITGYSRDDIFIRDIKGSEIGVDINTKNRLEKIRSEKPGAHLFWYTPTFRRGQKTFNIEKVLNPNDLSKWLVENNAYLFVSLHPKYREQSRSFDYDNIVTIEDSDTYPLMSKFDTLISDYSSIFTDFILLDKPIIFYPYDKAEYEKNEGLVTDYDSITPGQKAYNPTQLISAMADIVNGKDAFQDERTKIKNLYHLYHDGKASERIFETITSSGTHTL
jgi:CDP-glycerol glycerophosphotransferase (TagB/SpsB family)